MTAGEMQAKVALSAWQILASKDAKLHYLPGRSLPPRTRRNEGRARCLRAANPNGVPSTSPGLRRTRRYPGTPCPPHPHNPNGVVSGLSCIICLADPCL